MSENKKKHKVSLEVKNQILHRIKEEGVSVGEAASEHGLHPRTIYAWLTKGASLNPSWSEIRKLERENQELLTLIGEITVKLSESQKKS